ncbi:7908_t:CDS:1 [Paraglomus occultum]|uniref:7908_t:CDS:1 n=1 Tax=Paraglomus occultum TaxID=144539 RepID=A0A9N9GCZ9_9GLOM|nr:7908_t:CDS:1 [Paraglomus occultum]
MMRARGHAYKRAYKNAIKIARTLLYQKIGDAYEIFHGNWLNFEDFKVSNPVDRLWEKLIKSFATDEGVFVDDETHGVRRLSPLKKSICAGFTKCVIELIPIVKTYDAFFHKLVYHMRYKEHVSIPEKIGAPETLRKNEITTEQPTLPCISEADQMALDGFLNAWNKAVNLCTKRALCK